MPKAPSDEIQKKALTHVKKMFDSYSTLLQWYRRVWYDLFRATYIFETERREPGQSKIFFPKCYEQVEKVAPRLTANDPKFVVKLNLPINPDTPEADMQAYSDVNQSSLNYFWKLGNCQQKFRTWAKGGLVYGVMFAKVDFDRKMRTKKEKTVVLTDDGEEVMRTVEKKEILMEFPTFRVPDILDLYFDPRIEQVNDMPAIIENTDQIRKSEILNNKELYFNIDQIKKLHSNEFASNSDNYKLNKFSAQGIPFTEQSNDDMVLTIRKYYGYFSETDKPEDEELMLITTVNDSVVIEYESIDFLPFEKFVPIEIPNQGVGKGIVEPVKQLQDAYNLTRNQRFENVSLVINRMWLMKQGAKIDPRRLVSRAGNVIPVGEMDSLIPVPTQDVTASSFEEANALNTEIQQVLGTIDSSQDSTDNSFTNLATGQRIRWNEYNTRFKAIKKNLEEALARLGEKMLMITAKRANQNPLIFDEKTKQFYEVAKEAFDSFDDFYTVSIVAGSTSSDSIENQREEALAKAQLGIAYKAQGVNIDLDKLAKESFATFPGTNVDEIVLPPIQQPMGGPGSMPQSTVDQAQVQPSPEDLLNKSLTGV